MYGYNPATQRFLQPLKCLSARPTFSRRCLQFLKVLLNTGSCTHGERWRCWSHWRLLEPLRVGTPSSCCPLRVDHDVDHDVEHHHHRRRRHHHHTHTHTHYHHYHHYHQHHHFIITILVTINHVLLPGFIHLHLHHDRDDDRVRRRCDSMRSWWNG